MKSYQVYVFDLDDTLLATYRSVTSLHYPLVAERLGLRYRGEEAARRTWGQSFEEGLPAIFEGDATPDQVVSELARVHAEHPLAPAEGALHILRTLRKHGKFLAIVTSGAPGIVEQGIRRGLELTPETFDCVYSTVQHGTAKPSPVILDAIFTELERTRGARTDPREVVYIGDSLSDYRTAKSHGVDFVAVTTGVHTREDFLAEGLAAEWIFASLKEAIVPPASHGIVALIQNEAGEYLLVQEARPHNPFSGRLVRPPWPLPPRGRHRGGDHRAGDSGGVRPRGPSHTQSL